MSRPMSLLISCALCAGVARAESPFYVRGELLYMVVSGGPALDQQLLGAAEGDDYDGFVPRIDLGYELGDHWAVELSYTHLGELQTHWVSPSLPPFPGEDILPAFGYFDVSETIYAVAVSPKYRMTLFSDWELAVGPSLTYFRDEIEIGNYNRDEVHEDVRLGADVSFSRAIRDRWQFSLDYHYLNPPEKKAHLFGASIGFQF